MFLRTKLTEKEEQDQLRKDDEHNKKQYHLRGKYADD